MHRMLKKYDGVTVTDSSSLDEWIYVMFHTNLSFVEKHKECSIDF